MILVDANLLLYAANRAAPEHEAARHWLDDRLSGSARVGLAWPWLLAVLRLASNPLVMLGERPLAQVQKRPRPNAFPAIPVHPTRDHALKALEVLDRPMRAFPFAADADRSVARAALLTALVRPSLLTAPLVAFDAPTAGSRNFSQRLQIAKEIERKSLIWPLTAATGFD